MEQYIQKARAGDEEAFAYLVEHYEERLKKVAYRYVNDRADVEDVVQQTFLQAFKALHQLQELKYFWTWLYKILVRESYRILKKQERLGQLHEALAMQLDNKEPRIETDVTTAIRELKRPYQLAIMLHYFYDFKVMEIAHIMGKPVNTVKMYLHRGRKELRGVLERLNEKEIGMKEVKHMLKQEMFAMAQKYADVPAHYELALNSYVEGGVSSFMWQGKAEEEPVYLHMNSEGRLTDFLKLPTKEGEPISLEEKRIIAKNFLHAQYPDALMHYEHVTERDQGSNTIFRFEQQVHGLRLEAYYCRIEVTHCGEVISFTYRGYITEPAQIPKELYPPEKLLERLYRSEWSLRTENLIDGQGIQVMYKSAMLAVEAFDAMTGEAIDEIPRPEYNDEPFPHVELLEPQTTIEGMLKIDDSWERTDDSTDKISWRPKAFEPSINETFADYVKSSHKDHLWAVLQPENKRIISFMAFVEQQGEDVLTEEDCLCIAAQFVATYFHEFMPYLFVSVTSEKQEEEGKAYFIFSLQKDGYTISNEYFHIGVSKKDGSLLLVMTPDMSFEELAAFSPPSIRPVEALLPAEGIFPKLQWKKVYGEKPGLRLIYSFETANSEPVLGIDAQTGVVVACKLTLF